MADRLHASVFLTLFNFQTFFLLIKPRGIIALPGNAFPAVELQNPFRSIVKEVAIMGNRHHRSRKAVQKLLEPINRFRVKVVGRFIEQKHVGTRKQKTAERHAALFAARKNTDLCIPRRQSKRIGCDFHLGCSIGTGSRDDCLKTGLFSGQRIKIRIRLSVGCIHRIQFGLSLHHFAHAFFNRFTNGFFRI